MPLWLWSKGVTVPIFSRDFDCVPICFAMRRLILKSLGQWAARLSSVVLQLWVQDVNYDWQGTSPLLRFTASVALGQGILGPELGTGTNRSLS